MGNTINYNLQKPPKGTQNWDTLLNGNFDVIDTEIKSRKNEIGVLTNLNTNAKTDLVSATNEVVSQLTNNKTQVFNIKYPPTPLVGCKCDGVTDDSIAFQNLNNFLSANGGGTMKLPRSTNEIVILNQDINLNSNVDIEGYGWNSKIKCNAGSSGNGVNILKAVEKSNIRISNLTIENMGFGKSGTWTPTGTFDGVGACILAVGCNNFVVDRCIALNGGGANGTNEGIGNIYYSCCTNSKIINNYVSLCDNGIVVDSWYNQYTGKSSFINDGVIVQGNTVTQGGGRGICIENVSATVQKGSIVVNGNTINKMAYAGIQGNHIYNCIISNNSVDGDNTGRTYGNSADFTWYGIEFVSGSSQAVISNNTFKNFKYNGIRCFEANDLSIIGNNIKNCSDFAIFVKNVNDTMSNVKVDNNNINTLNGGICFAKDINAITIQNNSCCNNIVKFNTTGGTTGITFPSQLYSKCDGNIISPVVTYGSTIGLKLDGSTKCTINSNIINSVTIGINLYYDLDSISDGNVIESCTNAYHLDSCQKTIINSKIRGGTTAFDIVNGKTSQSQKCRALNCDITSTNVKNGNGIIVKYKSDAVPSSGTWDVGDIQEYLTPTAGGNIGNVCVTSGSPGVWKSYGAISV